jgi:TfoX/Sxy family transcriptional regulator of competence genes
MAYDAALAHRIRELLAERNDVVEKRMFGGLAFLVGGHLAVAASGQGGALVRVDPDRTDALVARSKAEVAVMRGRPMAGWVRVASDDLRTTRQLSRWVRLALEHVEALPPKRPRR